jgi:acyl-CoA thioester hydrolase
LRRGRQRTPGERFIEAEAEIRVRFQEVDPLGVVWHGHYLGFFETARAVFGERHGLEYLAMRENGFVAPIVHAEVDYFRSARLGERLTVRARLHPEPGAWMTFTYLVTSPDCDKLATGQTVQAFTDLEGKLLLTRPAFYEEWLRRCDGST